MYYDYSNATYITNKSAVYCLYTKQIVVVCITSGGFLGCTFVLCIVTTWKIKVYLDYMMNEIHVIYRTHTH